MLHSAEAREAEHERLLVERDCTRRVFTCVFTLLRDSGLRIAIEGFGTGDASMSYLRKLPFEKPNLARCFCQGLRPRDAHPVVVYLATASLSVELTPTQ